MALPSTNLRHMAIFDMSSEAKKVINVMILIGRKSFIKKSSIGREV